MFDSSLCTPTLTKLPAFLKWWKFPLLNKTLPLVVFILLFFGLRWIIQQTQWKPWLSDIKGNLLLFCLTATLPVIMFFVADKALIAFLPTDSGTVADSIVILGRGSNLQEDRVRVAAELWQAKRAPMIFVSGKGEARSLIRQLGRKGIPDQVLDGENCSATTLENAIFTAAILQPQGIRRILLVTDPQHMLRSLLVFRAYGFTVFPKTSPLPPYFGGFKVKASLTLREWVGLISYSLRGLLFGSHSPEEDSPELVKVIQQAREYGQQRHLR